MDLKKLLIRTSSGLIYVAIIVGCVIWGNTGITALGALFGITAVLEFYHILYPKDDINSRLPMYLDCLGVVLLSMAFWEPIPFLTIILWIIVMADRFVVQLYYKDRNPVSDLAKSMLTQVYIGLPIFCMSCASFTFHSKMILVVFLMLWINDTGAYLVGSLLGRHKLFERISPKKSWEGFWGGFAFNIIAAILFAIFDSDFCGTDLTIAEWIVLAVLITVFGTWGDLIESMFKRHYHIKDSGNIIPGHGGILDRIDSFLLAMPIALAYFLFITLI